MDINRMREFSHLASSLSFAETANHFYVSHSVLSKHIASIEEELGAKLFIRDSHHVSLTPAGETFARDAGIILGDYDRALAHLRALGDSSSAVVTVGYMRNACRPFMTKFVERMGKEHPEVRLDPRCLDHGDELFKLDTNGIDLGLGLVVDRNDVAGCRVLDIYEDRYQAVVGENHPFAKLSSVSVDMLEDEELIVPDPRAFPELSRLVENLFPADHGTLNLHECGDIDTLFLTVATQRCVGFAPEHDYPVFAGRDTFIPIEGAHTSFFVSAFVKEDKQTPATEACFQVLERCRRELAKKFAAREKDGLPKFDGPSAQY